MTTVGGLIEMAHRSFTAVPASVRQDVVLLATEVIESAASYGFERWGLTPFDDGFRVNVGWTEILTAGTDGLRVLLDGAALEALEVPESIECDKGEDDRGFYPSVPGSRLARLPYKPKKSFTEAIELLRPAVLSAVQVAARRRIGRGVKAGHDQGAVAALARLVGRDLPSTAGALTRSRRRSSEVAGGDLMEGALRRVVSSAFERNRSARNACLDHFGTSCAVCHFSFEATYGEIGRGFIHVHHSVPLATIGREYRVDPIADLRPVCPNCHSMLHSSDPPLTVEALARLVASRTDR